MISTPNLRSIWVLLLLTYSALLASGSLYPLSTWQGERMFDLSFLWAAWPHSISRIDLLTNLFIYVPFGILATRALFRRHYSLAHWLSICLLGAAFSTAMECLQLFVPSRVASNVDIITNSAGAALGAALAPLVSRRSLFFAWLVALRRHWFRPGWIVNLGLILLVLWLLAQFSLQKPGLVAGSLHGGFTPFWESSAAQFRPSLSLLFALDIASVSLFIATLLRPDQRLLPGAFGLAFGAIVFKFLAAALLIKLAFLVRLLSLEALLGIGLGASAALAFVYVRAGPPPYPLLAGVLSALILAKLTFGVPFLTATGHAPDLAARPELLFNIGGIAYLVSESWGYLALGCALALWERDDHEHRIKP
jgi:VanZ family protein